MNLKQKIIWITGASSGIGKSLAIELSKLDTKLILSSRNEGTLNDVKNQCDHSENIAILPIDLKQQLDLQLSQLDTDIKGKYRALGKLSGNEMALLDNSLRQMAGSASSLIGYASKAEPQTVLALEYYQDFLRHQKSKHLSNL